MGERSDSEYPKTVMELEEPKLHIEDKKSKINAEFNANKEPINDMEVKDPKVHKEPKEHKEKKEHKEPKEHKEKKSPKEEPADLNAAKDEKREKKEHKEPKEHKEKKVTKDEDRIDLNEAKDDKK